MSNHILLIDTSDKVCTVGIALDGQLLSVLQHDEQNSQAAAINLLIEELVKQAQIKISDIAAIAVCSGPGSYTGLRVGMATAKGLAMALTKPIIAHNKLELLAISNHLFNDSFWNYVIILNARPNEYFAAVYDADIKVIEQPKLYNTQELESLMDSFAKKAVGYFGDSVSISTINKTILAHQNINFQAWAAWALYSFLQNNFEDTANVEPFYMKEVFIHEPREKKLGNG